MRSSSRQKGGGLVRMWRVRGNIIKQIEEQVGLFVRTDLRSQELGCIKAEIARGSQVDIAYLG